MPTRDTRNVKPGTDIVISGQSDREVVLQVDFTIENDGSIKVAAANRSAAPLFGMLQPTSPGEISVEDMDREIAARTAADDQRIRDQKS